METFRLLALLVGLARPATEPQRLEGFAVMSLDHRQAAPERSRVLTHRGRTRAAAGMEGVT
jgi:hypothetical protein